MTRKILHGCDICSLQMDQEFSAHMEVYAIGETRYDEPRTDLCPRCWGIGLDAMKSAYKAAMIEEETQ